MTELEPTMDQAFDDARSFVLKVLIARGRKVIPEGWAIVLAVGWGVTLIDADGTCHSTMDDFTACKHDDLKDLYGDCERFAGLFGVANERLTHDSTIDTVYDWLGT